MDTGKELPVQEGLSQKGEQTSTREKFLKRIKSGGIAAILGPLVQFFPKTPKVEAPAGEGVASSTATETPSPLPTETAPKAQTKTPSQTATPETPTATPPPTESPTPEPTATASPKEILAQFPEKNIDGVQTYGHDRPLSKEDLNRFVTAINNTEFDMLDDTYYATMLIYESAYKEFPKQNNDENF